jgi:hypothetical protein
MPVQFDEYERHATEVDWQPTPESNAATVLGFLIRHRGTGFTPSEIASETEIPRGSVGPTLQRLQERGLVRHREPYWAIAEDDRIAAYESMLRGMEALADDDAWSEVDVDAHTVDDADLAEWRESGEDDG